MKTLFQKKVCTLFLSILMTCAVARAQIAYTDINPDQTFVTNNASFVLDLNNDGVDDFRFSISMVTSPFSQNTVSILPLNGGEYADIAGPGATFPLPLQANQLIASQLSWETAGHPIIYATKTGSQWQVYGAWFGGPYFIGLRVHAASQIFYGWIQLKATAGASGAYFTIYDYAYNAGFKQSITAGQKCPPPSVVTANGPTTFCQGQSVVLSANSGVAFSYQWKFNGFDILGGIGKNFTAANAGNYTVKVLDNIHNCSKISAATVVVTVICKETSNAEPASENKELNVFPNPSSNQFTVQLPTNNEATLRMTNLVGETVFEGKINNGAGVIDVSSFAKGLYLISVSTPDDKYFSKFLKQ